MLGKRSAQFSSALLIVVKNSEKLSECDPKSVMASAMIAATLDLSIDPNLGQAHIVPYKKVAQLQIGYKGFIQLAQRSGQFKAITDTVIPCGVLISHNPLTEELVLDWGKAKTGKEDKPDGYVFYFKLLNGFEKTIFWSYKKAFDHGMEYSFAFKNGWATPWKSNFDSMALKSVIKYGLGRYAPLSIEMQTAIEEDQKADGEYIDNLPAAEPVATFAEKAEDAKPVQGSTGSVGSASQPESTGSVTSEEW